MPLVSLPGSTLLSKHMLAPSRISDPCINSIIFTYLIWMHVTDVAQAVKHMEPSSNLPRSTFLQILRIIVEAVRSRHSPCRVTVYANNMGRCPSNTSICCKNEPMLVTILNSGKEAAHHVEDGAAAKVGGGVARIAGARAQSGANKSGQQCGGCEGAVADVGAQHAHHE